MLLCSESVKEKLEKELLFSKELVDDNRLEESCGLAHQIEWLKRYAHHNNEKAGCEFTHIELVPDFAPHSFCFIMWALAKENHPKAIQPGSYAAKQYPELVGYTFWFNGGLIFHGAHDGGGDGGPPTFSVSLVPVNGWSVHT